MARQYQPWEPQPATIMDPGVPGRVRALTPGVCPDGHVWEVRPGFPFVCSYRPRRGPAGEIATPTCGRHLVFLEPDEEAAYAIGGLDAVKALKPRIK